MLQRRSEESTSQEDLLSQEEKPLWEELPAPWIGRFMQFYIFGKPAPLYQDCPQCLKPYAIFFSSYRAHVMRNVCRKWRLIFFQSLVINPLTAPPPLPYCFEPTVCFGKYAREIIMRHKKAKQAFVPIKKR
jgi:hypothetical protein